MWTSKQVSLGLKQLQKICSSQAPLSSMFNNPVCGLDFNDVVGIGKRETRNGRNELVSNGDSQSVPQK